MSNKSQELRELAFQINQYKAKIKALSDQAMDIYTGKTINYTKPTDKPDQKFNYYEPEIIPDKEIFNRYKF